MARVRLGTMAGPLSLLLLPKCPMCIVSLIAAAGLTIPSSMPSSIGLSLAAGLLVAGWLAAAFVMTRGQPLLRAASILASGLSLAAIQLGNRPLLWVGIAAMSIAVLAASRRCARMNASS